VAIVGGVPVDSAARGQKAPTRVRGGRVGHTRLLNPAPGGGAQERQNHKDRFHVSPLLSRHRDNTGKDPLL